MALIICPECHKEVSDKAKNCVHCGFPLEEYVENVDELTFKPHTVCPSCNKLNDVEVFRCVHCNYGYKLHDYNIIYPKKEFTGIYKNYWGEMVEVYCPKCGSSNCSHRNETKMVRGKSRYGLNLNPLKPFTLFNKKETTRTVVESNIVCNNCGFVFK